MTDSDNEETRYDVPGFSFQKDGIDLIFHWCYDSEIERFCLLEIKTSGEFFTLSLSETIKIIFEDNLGLFYE